MARKESPQGGGMLSVHVCEYACLYYVLFCYFVYLAFIILCHCLYHYIIVAVGNRMMMIDRKLSSRRTPAHSLSITARGAIPFMHLDSNRYLAANASLYTVLVTDQPIERLRLKK